MTAPVGLDIGSQTVPEIAISIVAELIARRNVGLRRPSEQPESGFTGEGRRRLPASMPAPAARHDRRDRSRRRTQPADGTPQTAVAD